MPRDYTGLAIGEALKSGIQAFRDERAWQDKMARNAREEEAAKEKIAYERSKEKPFTEEQLTAAKETGRLTGPGVTRNDQLEYFKAGAAADALRAKLYRPVTPELRTQAAEFGIAIPDDAKEVPVDTVHNIEKASILAAAHKDQIQVTPEMAAKKELQDIGATPGTWWPKSYIEKLTAPKSSSTSESAALTEVTDEAYKSFPALGKAGFKPGQKIATSTFNLYTKPTTPGAGGAALTDEQITLNAKSIANGDTTLGMLGGMGSQRARINAEYEKMREANPSLAPMHQLEANLKSEYQRARTLNSQQTTDQVAAVDQFTRALDEAVDRATALDMGNFKPYNAATQAVWENVQGSKKSKDLAVLKAMASEMALQSSRVFAGSAASDIQFKTEMQRLSTAQSAKNFKAVAAALRQIAQTRKTAMLDMPTFTTGGGTIPAGGSLQPSQNGLIRFRDSAGGVHEISGSDWEKNKADILKEDPGVSILGGGQ